MANEFRINKDYAEKYNQFRQKEELQKCQNKAHLYFDVLISRHLLFVNVQLIRERVL